MTATPAEHQAHERSTQNAVNIGVVEMLLRPEYSMDFIEECISDFQKDTNILIDPNTVADRLDAALASLAADTLASLPAAQRAAYVKE